VDDGGSAINKTSTEGRIVLHINVRNAKYFVRFGRLNIFDVSDIYARYNPDDRELFDRTSLMDDPQDKLESYRWSHYISSTEIRSLSIDWSSMLSSYQAAAALG